MEKRTPHCKLRVVKQMVAEGLCEATITALGTAREMGLGFSDMKRELLRLEAPSFYKSMTTHADHRLSQNVYRHTLENGLKACVKLTVHEGVLIVSFKEL